jgi:hypothetical protein
MGTDDEIMETERLHDFLSRSCTRNRGAIASSRFVQADVANKSKMVDFFMVPGCNGGIK